ncbi:MAG: DUF2281 domain-containing protein [Defluviitaleaceae bacterium]|nr:DUF2281 domain-containing protein [Defluviitaleaceae bacterium]
MRAIKTADLTQDFKRVADQVVQGETVLISRPRNENLVIITESDYNELVAVSKSKIRTPKLGGWEDKIFIADDFNEPMDEFKEYM